MTTQKDVDRIEEYVQDARTELEVFEHDNDSIITRHTFLMQQLLAAEEEYRLCVLELEYTAGEEE
tara:strand:+ start:1441 stop:1635 length:195 start_codon:yes stop_codon:yes gene_type:complete